MHEKVREYLEGKRQEREDMQRKEKNELEQAKRANLLRLGLLEKEYSEGGVSAHYPEWDHETEKAFRKVPINVTDEEYAEICSYQNAKTITGSNDNPIAKALAVIAWITFIGGFIAGIVFANQEVVTGHYSADTIFIWSAAVTYWAASFASGIVFLGFAEVIKLLHSMSTRVR